MAKRTDKSKSGAEGQPSSLLNSVATVAGAASNPLSRLAEAVNRTVNTATSGQDSREEEEVLQAALKTIAVVAFVGPPGTGKSTRAIRVARENNIEFLIDDGLLIRGSRIVAGTSAKRAASKIDSVRQAIFADETRAQTMRRTLAAHQPAALMILGTSDAMLEKICANLWLNPPAMLIRIEDVSSEEEMRQARQTRMTEGKHTIPVPSMEIKHEFSGTFLNPISRLRRRFDRDRGVQPVQNDAERTVVRPTFSTLGSYSISDEALRSMIELILRRIRGVSHVVDCKISKEIYGVVIHLDLALLYGFNAQIVLREAQEKVSHLVEEFTSINVMVVNVKARRVVYQTAGQPAGGSQ